jgi:hypothetical protein
MRAKEARFPRALLGNERQLVSQAVTASIGVALCIAVFLLTRRLAGAFSSPLPVSQLVLTAAIALAWAIGARELTARSAVHTTLAVIVLLILAIACSYPGHRVVDWLVWPLAMFLAAWSPAHLRSSVEPIVLRIDHLSENQSEETAGEHISQQLTRLRTEEGHDALRGTLVAEFPVGERQVTLFIAFCPAFERLPEVDANIADDSDASVKLTQVLHNGAQLEVRFPEPVDEPAQVAIELFASDATPL